MELGKWRPVAGVLIIGYFLLTVIAPLLVLLYTSLLKFYAPPSKDTFKSMTLDNYRALAHTADAITALKNSLILGLASATLVMAFMAVAAWIVVRSRIRGRKILDGLAFLPLVVPGLVMGLALSFVYLRSPIPIYGTLFILLISYCTRYLPYGMRYSVTSMQQIANELEESALVDGCGTFGALRRVMLHAVRPGIVTVGLFAFLAAWNEFFAALILLNSSDKFTLPLAVVAMRGRNFGAIDYPTLQSGVVFMAVPCLILFLVLQRSYVRGFMSGALRG